MEIKRISGSTYTILEHRGKYRLVKIVGEYATEGEGFSDMVSIMEGVKSESKVEEQKWKNRKR